MYNGNENFQQQNNNDNTLGIVALVCGILSMYTCVTGIPGIICGVIARKRNRYDTPALIGIIISVASLVLMFLAVVGFTIFAIYYN